MRAILPILLTAQIVLLGCSSDRVIAAREAADSLTLPPVEQQPAGVVVGQTLAAGQFSQPAAEDFSDPGFHEVVMGSHSLAQNMGSTAGAFLVVALRDIDRIDQACSSEHPLSGCATVDWSDFDGRPGVPPSGVFDNRLSLVLQSGTRHFFLSESSALVDAPDLYKPT